MVWQVLIGSYDFWSSSITVVNYKVRCEWNTWRNTLQWDADGLTVQRKGIWSYSSSNILKIQHELNPDVCWLSTGNQHVMPSVLIMLMWCHSVILCFLIIIISLSHLKPLGLLESHVNIFLPKRSSGFFFCWCWGLWNSILEWGIWRMCFLQLEFWN